MRRWLLLALAALALLGSTPAFAVNPDEVLSDPKLEARARALSSELRCLVCQNQSIDDSDAPLARDLRLIVREKLKAGENETQIRTFLVDRYGEFVLLKPTFTPHTVLLWAGPFLVLLAGIGIVWANAKRRTSPTPVSPLTDEERVALDRLDQVG
ncbi:cytochrome c-type biogenesis protein CcmH [Alsobacter soli]|uniref:Cytochrome c-type biogenesis protein n=1 Tax=Alsobacter soli TaxID=2109933 RepID=A0A2T1HS93_9HYPH|nr:cytochrome c-type biogenesis protein [Alsobacter soli]PSC04507.1 cytochrome c-type biogenesis protein CcmH [Alsobacter soli]